jgi:GNAT superfamily N-acetyltransferase
MATTAPPVRRATVDDREPLARLFATAFEADPLLRFFFPDDETYPAFAETFFGYLVDVNLEGGDILIAGDLLAAAIWTPPGGLGISDDAQERRWNEAVAPLLPADALERLDRFDRAATELAPEEPHRYLGVLATHPRHQGRGFATSVLTPMIERDDRDRIPQHLETATPENLPFYRRLGFEVRAETEVERGPHLWELVRPPAGPVDA